MEPVKVDQVLDGGQASRPGAATIGTTSAVVLQGNYSRKQAAFTNDSDTAIYGCKGREAVLNAGIRINANGGSWVIEPDATGRIYTGPVSFISSAGGKNLCWTEDF